MSTIITTPAAAGAISGSIDNIACADSARIGQDERKAMIEVTRKLRRIKRRLVLQETENEKERAPVEQFRTMMLRLAMTEVALAGQGRTHQVALHGQQHIKSSNSDYNLGTASRVATLKIVHKQASNYRGQLDPMRLPQ